MFSTYSVKILKMFSQKLVFRLSRYFPKVRSQSFKQSNLAQLEGHETVNTISKHYIPRVAGSIPVRDNFFG